MKYRICDVEEKHIAQLVMLEKLCFSVPWTADQLKAQMKDGMHEFICALDEQDRVLGYVGMMYVLDEGYISNVATAPDCRRQGIADELIEKLSSIAAEHKLSFVTLEVRESNLAAFSLYEKHGFQTVGKRKGYYSFPKEDAILMTKFLNRGAELENTCY